MRRLLALCLLVMFAVLATTDTFACPDGCQSASSPTTAERCNSSGSCVFCSGGAIVSAIDAPVTALHPTLPVPERLVPAAPRTAPNVLDQPPRTA